MYVKLHNDFAGDELALEAAQIVKNCVHCGFCNATCPTYQEYFDERDGPRGRIYLIRHMLESGRAGDVTRLHLDRCLTCRACETTCPSGVRYGRLVDIGRELVERQTGRPALDGLRRRFARLVFPYRRRVGFVLAVGRALRWLLPSHLAREIPLRQVLPPPTSARASLQRKMIALGGCVQAAATPRTNDAARRVLGRLGIDLVEIPSAGCCGAVSYHLGAQDEGLDFMRRNVDAWWPHIEGGAEAIVTTASGCGVLVKDYGELLKGDAAYAARARRVSELARDLSEVLDGEDLGAFRETTVRRSTAVHCPCTLSHGQKLAGAVERILERAGVPLAETVEGHLCCGSAGTYSLFQPETSQRLLNRKLAALTRSNPEQIVTANVGCQLHLGAKSEVPVRHWIELLDDDL